MNKIPKKGFKRINLQNYTLKFNVVLRKKFIN